MERTYEIVRRIGSGGMAEVFEGRALGPGGFERRVAIKRMRHDLRKEPEVRAMLRDELTACLKLYHANIVNILDVGEMDGDPFLVTELVDGLDGARSARLGAQAGAPMPLAVALHLVSEVAHALAYVHGLTDDRGAPRPLLHRDVSPSNILLSWNGDVKLGDFGIAWTDRREAETQPGLLKGKAGYMPPERLRGEPAVAAGDVFALGMCLRQWAEAEVLPDDVDRFVRRVTADDPAERPAARDVARQADALARPLLTDTPRSSLESWMSGLRVEAEREQRSSSLLVFAPMPIVAGLPATETLDSLFGPEARAVSSPPPPPAGPAAESGTVGIVRRSVRPIPLASQPILAAPAAPFADWTPHRSRREFGFFWYVPPSVIVTQIAVAHGSTQAATVYQDTVDELIALLADAIAEHDGLTFVHDWRAMRSYESEARRVFLERIRARKPGYLRRSWVVIGENPFLRLAAQAVNLATSLVGSRNFGIAARPEDVLGWLGIEGPPPRPHWADP